MRNRVYISIILSVMTVAGCFFSRSVTNASPKFHLQDSRRRQSRQTKQSRNQAKPARDYSRFTHRSDKHKSLVCGACHKAPTANWLTESTFPDVADYPAHEACTGCHRAQFFKGAKPVICSICHTKVSPRSRERFTFMKPDQPSQFTTVFPHDKHQDVIAANKFGESVDSAHAIVRRAFFQDKTRANYNNCTICHVTQTRSLSPQGGFPDGFKPPAGTFKTAPAGHESCFNCHWKNQEPTHENCDGCHRVSQTDIPVRLAPERKSLKFLHIRDAPENQHEDECTVCHINITREKSVVGLKPDVPITSCSGCHGSSSTKDKETIRSEVERRNLDPNFVCRKCHTSNVGSKRPVPASHTAAIN